MKLLLAASTPKLSSCCWQPTSRRVCVPSVAACMLHVCVRCVVVRVQTGKDAGKLDIPWSYNAVWDVLGDAEEVESCCLVSGKWARRREGSEAVMDPSGRH